MRLPQGWEWLIIVLLIVLLFGAKRLPDAARGLGRSLRIFKAETKGLAEDTKNAAKEDATGADETPAVTAADKPAVTAEAQPAPHAAPAQPAQPAAEATAAPAEQRAEG
ncbi:MAG: Sec-independent protein translocase subunit TatA [Candidatus Nanopelagicales bacterium]